jgi:hypothetical protein
LTRRAGKDHSRPIRAAAARANPVAIWEDVMIVREVPDGSLMLIGQTDHSRFVGQLAAHWGNESFAPPQPYESVVRAATYHDYGWLRYETSPLLDGESGKPYPFLRAPMSQEQVDGYQWCVDWLADIDRYSALLVSRHRTGLWRARYGTIDHPAGYNVTTLNPAAQQLLDRNEAWQAETLGAMNESERGQLATTYALLQVWDLLGLYFCCQEPCDDYIEPVPMSYADDAERTRLTMTPRSATEVAFDPYPFDARPLTVQLNCKRLPTTRFADQTAFRKAYFQAPTELHEFTLV